MRGTSALAAFTLLLLSLCFQAVDATRRGRSRSCFRNEFEASSIGSLLVASFWRDIQASGCDNDKILKVYQTYFTEDVTFKANGQVRLTSMTSARGELHGARSWLKSYRESCIVFTYTCYSCILYV